MDGSKSNEGNEITLYIIGKDNEIFKKLFREINEIEREEENQKLKILEGKDFSFTMTDSKDENKLIRKLSKRFSIKLIGYKYLELSNDNSKNIILNIFKTIKSSPCKNNIIINFETTIVNLLSNLNNKLETDKPFILFNFLDTFKNFKYPQYISYLILPIEKMIQKNYILKLSLTF